MCPLARSSRPRREHLVDAIRADDRMTVLVR